MKSTMTVLLVAVLSGAGLTANVSPAHVPVVRVSESDGIYRVDALFQVASPPQIVHAVLTDYEQIPRFMPDVRKSVVRERSESSAIVEQEAVSKVMMFSKTVHLVLHITEQPGALRFRDRCGKSFSQYEGGWTFSEQNGRTAVAYELTAKPSFDVPEFLVKRLLRRDSGEMIERLQREIARRSTMP